MFHADVFVKLALGLALMGACSCGLQPKPFLTKVLVFTYADFGPPSETAVWLGEASPSKRVVVHYDQSVSALESKYPSSQYKHVRVTQALFRTNQTLKNLPQTPANAPVRERLKNTRDALTLFHRDRRIHMSAIPPSPRGLGRRASMVF